MDVHAILSKGFHRSLADLDIFEIGVGRVKARLVVGAAVQNFFGTLHGGAIATLVDDVGSFAVMATDHFHRIGVTTDLHVSYFSAGAADDSILINASVASCGLSLAFVEVTLTSASRGNAIARGQLTKFLGPASASKSTSETRNKTGVDAEDL